MKTTRTKRKTPMTFVNRGGKGAAGTSIDEVEPGRSMPYGIATLESDRAKPSGRTPTAGHERSPTTRSSRV